ncbi:MAG: hypothetical protein IV101_08465 [Dechloromonas sp.]|uniref:hypothetical protein n=1 Tax=Dechloromonas sp. TaxID=1917218 RepID=UPI0027EF6965|nr:hypothetical protein [Dechloromonas sp.]MBT9520916.1 hypothetical protein [Dechloromonas sp.]
MKIPSQFLRAMLLPIAASAVMTAAAADPMLSGPSAVSMGERVEFRGANFVPNTLVNVVVIDPKGGQQKQMVSVPDGGIFSQEVIVNSDGGYEIKATDESGKVLTAVRFSVTP